MRRIKQPKYKSTVYLSYLELWQWVPNPSLGGQVVLPLPTSHHQVQGSNTAGGGIQIMTVFVCVEVLRPNQPNGVMPSVVSLPNHTFTGQA